MKQTELTITGMSCGHCVAAVDRALRRVPGVRTAQVEVGHARVECDDATPSQALVAAVEDEGFQAAAR